MTARAAGSAIFNKLTTSAGTALWASRVRRGKATEADIIGGQTYIVFDYAAGGPINAQKTRMEDLRFDVECFDLTLSTAETGADYIDSALHNQILTTTGYSNWATTVIGEISRDESHEGKTFWVRGKQVRVRLSSTT